MNHNGKSTVTIKGEQSDMEEAKAYIIDLTKDIFAIAEENSRRAKNEPVKEEPIEIIDWQAIYQQSEESSKQKWASFPDVIKCFYTEDPFISSLSPLEVAAFRESNNNIKVDRAFKDKPLGDVPVPNPVQRFDQCFSAYPDLLNEIVKAGFQRPSPIQCQAWPVLLKGEDLIGIAQTGTGKTLAFLLPAMIHTEGQTTPRDKRTGPTVLVMAPTRELALQIEKEVGKYQFRNMRA